MQTSRRSRRLHIVAALGFTALILSVDAVGAAGPRLSTEAYPVVDGSTSAQPLGALVACRLTHTDFAWGGQLFDRTRLLYPTTDPYDPAKRLSLDHQATRPGLVTNIHGRLWAKIRHSGTHQSYVNLISRKAQLILAARGPSDDERRLARENGVEIETLPIALDAFVFIGNGKNPVAAITVEQIRGIYAGTLTNWAALGGPDHKINAYQRNKNSGSQEMMELLVMKGLKMIASTDLEIPTSMIGPFNALRDDVYGIGYTFYYYDTYMAALPEVKMLAVDGVFPHRGAIADRSYPFVTEVFIAYLTDLPADSPAARVRTWLLTPDGQAVVGESGYVPIKDHSPE